MKVIDSKGQMERESVDADGGLRVPEAKLEKTCRPSSSSLSSRGLPKTNRATREPVMPKLHLHPPRVSISQR